MTVKVRAAAEATGRKFYLMYDVTGWTARQPEIKNDWLTKMRAHTASPAYARQNGRPVVCIWGFGFNDDGRPFAPAQCLEVINWFKAQGCYVIGGVPTYWRQGINDSRPGFSEVYHASTLSALMVGRTAPWRPRPFYRYVNTPTFRLRFPRHRLPALRAARDFPPATAARLLHWRSPQHDRLAPGACTCHVHSSRGQPIANRRTAPGPGSSGTGPGRGRHVLLGRYDLRSPDGGRMLKGPWR